MAWAGGFLAAGWAADRKSLQKVASRPGFNDPSSDDPSSDNTLVRGPGLGITVRVTPFFRIGLKADGPRPRLCLLFLASGSSNQSVPSNFRFPLLHPLRALSTVSLAQGSGSSGTGGHLNALPISLEGLILTLTGLWMHLRLRWECVQHQVSNCPFSLLGESPAIKVLGGCL